MNKDGQGTLYLCGTPIGNLEDVTLRLVRILTEADIIAAEDTRRTLKLLNHLNIKKPVISCHEHNETARSEEIMIMLAEGKSVALVSDAGMPCISDPGEKVARRAIEEGYAVTVIPGPSAALAALSLSGLPTATFAFEGFLPREGKERRQALAKLTGETRTVILYESPYRLVKTLKDMRESMGERRVAVCRELTKVHEEVFRGTPEEAIIHFSAGEVKGEVAIVLEGKAPETSAGPDPEEMERLLAELLGQGLKMKEAANIAAERLGASKNIAYKTALHLSNK